MKIFTPTLFGVDSIFNSCKKESIEKNKTEEFVQSEHDAMIEGKICTFKEKMQKIKENPSLKSSYEDLTLNDAVWCAEAALNYTHADLGHEFAELTIDSIEIEIPIDADSLVKFSDVSEAYLSMDDNLEQFFTGIADDNKHVIVIDVEPVLNLNKSNTTTLIVKTVVGRGQTPAIDEVFGDTDWWYYGEDGGCCGGYSGDQPRDAAYELEFRVNHNNVNPDDYDPLNEGHIYGYFTDIQFETATYDDYENPNDPNDNINDYLLFYNTTLYSSENYHECIPPVEMNFYLNGLYSIIDTVKTKINAFRPTEDQKRFISCEVSDVRIPLLNQDFMVYHYADLKYGVLRFAELK